MLCSSPEMAKVLGCTLQAWVDNEQSLPVLLLQRLAATYGRGSLSLGFFKNLRKRYYMGGNEGLDHANKESTRAPRAWMHIYVHWPRVEQFRWRLAAQAVADLAVYNLISIIKNNEQVDCPFCGQGGMNAE